MELRQIRYFLKAKELLNFTEAAAQSFVTQSTLSQQIKQLEQELGVPLFDRIGKRVALTEAGRLFAEYAQKAVKQTADSLIAIQDLQELKTGTLQIGVTYGLRDALTQVLIQFAEQYPQIKIRVNFATSSELIKKLHNFELDFVLTFINEKPDPQLKYQELFQSPLVLVTSANTISDWSAKTSISLEKVAQLPLILPAKGYSTTSYIYTAFQQKNLSPNIAMEINDIPTLLQLVRTGTWHTILTHASIKDDEQLYGIPINGKKMLKTAMIVSIKDSYERQAVKAFWNILSNLK